MSVPNLVELALAKKDAEIEALAQSNRRLREGLEEAADTLDWVPGKKLTATEAIYLNKKRAAARAALKDNGHA